MDNRERAYFLVKFSPESREYRMSQLKCIGNIKFHAPYSHFEQGEYDGKYWKFSPDCMMSCRKDDVEAVRYELKKAKINDDYFNYVEIIEIG